MELIIWMALVRMRWHERSLNVIVGATVSAVAHEDAFDERRTQASG